MTDDDKASQPWGHLHVGLNHLNRPAQDVEKTETIGWGFNPEKTNPDVNGKAVQRMDQEELETLTYLSDGEREMTSVEKVLATMAGDMVGLQYRADFMRSSVAVKGRGRESVHKVLGGATPKISVPTTLSKIREKITGGKKETEMEWERQNDSS